MSDPVVVAELRRAARHLLQSPLTCAELHPDQFVLIRRHEQELDRWFTQRLGYRLEVTATTARLFKSTVVPFRRPLRAPTSTKRPFSQREYTMLALVFAAVAAGPRIISLRELVDDVRSAAVDAELTLYETGADRKALITALKWMIQHGLVTELHERIDRYADDEDADAVIEVDPDRLALVPLGALERAASPEALVDRSDRRTATLRQWLRARLVEDPVLYESDLTEAEWAELRRRWTEDAPLLDEMFGLTLEARAEGMAAIDHDGSLADRPFPVTRTLGHAALLLIGQLTETDESTSRSGSGSQGSQGSGSQGSKSQASASRPVWQGSAPMVTVEAWMAGQAERHRRHWAAASVDDPAGLVRDVLDLLADHRLVEVVRTPEGTAVVRLLPAGYRFAVTTPDQPDQPDPIDEAATLF